VGDGAGVTLGRAEQWRPAKVVLDVEDAVFASEVRGWAQAAGVVVVEGDDGTTRYDDIVVVGGDAELCERVFGRLANGGIFNLVLGQPLARSVSVDIGRMHYDNLCVVGTDSKDLAAAYQPVRTQLKPGGTTWVLGAAGPMGQMHFLRALSMPGKPARIVATNLHTARMEPVRRQFARQAEASHVDVIYLSRDQFDSDEAFFARKRDTADGRGFDDILIMAPTVDAIEQASDMTADDAVVNVFAGLARGTQARIDLNSVAKRALLL
jgi:threonine dehydrogenase-like Zn-dependent dehydrogenase